MKIASTQNNLFLNFIFFFIGLFEPFEPLEFLPESVLSERLELVRGCAFLRAVILSVMVYSVPFKEDDELDHCLSF